MKYLTAFFIIASIAVVSFSDTLSTSVVIKVDHLLDMRLAGEVTAGQFQAKKDEIERERDRFAELLKDNECRHDVWIENAEAMFSFSETAKDRFENGTIEDKRRILSCLGSNLLLTDGKLTLSLDSGLGLFLEVTPKLTEVQERLEPLESLDESVFEGCGGSACPVWLGSRDFNLNSRFRYKSLRR